MIKTTALEVIQPFGKFYVCKLTARDLLRMTFTDTLRYNDSDEVVGIQRGLDTRQRVKLVKQFVEGQNAALPNSIILGANYDKDGFFVDNDDYAWRYENGELIIPTYEKLASIIDGQHRIYGFENANEEAKSMELVCSVYLELPTAFQAYLFATINGTQKPVSKSLSYTLFGFEAEKEPVIAWSPDKLGIVLHNRFQEQSDSPFYGHIKLTPKPNERQKLEYDSSRWQVSTATIVDGIVRLISSNPKGDKYSLLLHPVDERHRSDLPVDRSPLRQLYLETQDAVLYKIVSNFFEAANALLLQSAPSQSYIRKTVGIQALFDVLNRILLIDKEIDPTFRKINLTKEKFYKILEPVKSLDFVSDKFQYSGVGRKRLADEIMKSAGIAFV